MLDPPSVSRDEASTDLRSNSVTATVPTLPLELIANIIELAILTASPCPIVPASSPSTSGDTPSSPFTTPLRAAYTSAWAWTGHLLYVSKFFYSIARPLLLRTLTLDTDAAARSFFTSAPSLKDQPTALENVERAWLGNVSSLERQGLQIDPIGLRLQEAAWYEECSGGFIVGHAYASRKRPSRKLRKVERGEGGGSRPKQYRTVSVYWAEEQLVEEVSDPDRSSDGPDHDSDTDGEAIDDDLDSGVVRDDMVQEPQLDLARSLPLAIDRTSEGHYNGTGSSWRRQSHHGENSYRDPRIDRPHEPAWQTLYSRPRRLSPSRARGQPSSSMASGSMSGTSFDPSGSSQPGPAEGDLDPWDMQDAQERLAALANSALDQSESNAFDASPSSRPTVEPVETNSSSLSIGGLADTVSGQSGVRKRRRRREIYAYHLCTATLEPWINPLLASLRSLRLITITFYPGHLLDDDKLEHMLRRILSPSETPRLQTLLIRIVFDANSAGSRMRRFERTKTIAGAADRIGDERVRVMLVNNRVGEGELVALPPKGSGTEHVSPLSRKAITLTKEAWWSRVLQQNHHSQKAESVHAGQTEVSRADETEKEREQRQKSNWQTFFPADQHVRPVHLVNLIYHCDAWPDHATPV